MRALSASEFLAVWEHGLDRPPYERALVLLGPACPEVAAEDLSLLSIGHRDALLLALRESAFGSELRGLCPCPHCDVTAEIELDTAQLLQAAAGEAAEAAPGIKPASSICLAGREFNVRAPNTADLAACAGLDAEDAARSILARCLTPALSDGSPRLSAGEILSAGEMEEVGQRMAALDPQAELQMNLVCAACRQSWTERFDIVGFLWNELDAWARRTLREVHALASRYGWTESQILALSATRRNLYLEMVSG